MQISTWVRYKTTFAKLDKLSTLAAVLALRDRFSRWEQELLEVFPGQDELVADLRALMHERLDIIQRRVQRHRGKPPRPDSTTELRDASTRLAREAHILTRMLQLEPAEPWLREVLTPAVKFSVELVSHRLARVESTASDGLSDLVDEARRALVLAEEGLEGVARLSP